ncbi:cupredoxin domain-containing protein [Sinomonas terrae]|uniref:Cupredoxin domain-containing protein n=1 Tax=Sinomonas terrae TaxID=2908838 RepID=A0ABS9U1B6_9MICC|nr:cupredoxin domain-containing protein [Sinomonas terrae]MCH6470125.1 cupredoxin domain-containing protein [Sinomonas terrae]
MSLIRARGRRLAAVAFLTGVAALGAAGCSAPGEGGPSTAQASPAHGHPTMDPGMAMGTPTGNGMPAAAVTIHIRGSAYSDPGPVAPGATVTVMNMDSQTHTVTADDGSFHAVAAPGESVAFTAPTMPGTYPYHCEYHPGMHAALTIQ